MSTPEAPVLDLQRRFVRVTERLPNGFVAFDFALGDPEIYAELRLPAGAFEEFCRSNAVEFLPEGPAPASPGEYED